MSIWLARAGLLKSLPLLDKAGKHFVFATPEPVLIHLHHLDRNAAGERGIPDGRLSPRVRSATGCTP